MRKRCGACVLPDQIHRSGVVRCPLQTSPDGLDIAGVDEEAGLPGDDQVDNPMRAAGQHEHAAEHRFEHDTAL
jgi:hypothetical protein